MPEILYKLKNMDIFKHANNSTLNKLINIGKIKNYKKNDIIYSDKKIVDYIFFILEGKAVICNMTHNGNRKIIFILGSGSLLSFNVINDKLSSVFSESIEKTQVLMIERTEFLKILKHDFEFLKSIMSEYEKYIWRMGHQLKNTIGNIYIERRVAAKLWKLGRDFGIKTDEGILIDIEMTITFMADFIGVPRESISRACKKLINEKLIKFENKKFIILNADKLAEYYKR